MADVRDRQLRARPVRFEEPHEVTVAGGERFPEQSDIDTLIEGNPPAVTGAHAPSTARGQGVQRESQVLGQGT